MSNEAFGNNVLLRVRISEWCQRFSEGREENVGEDRPGLSVTRGI